MFALLNHMEECLWEARKCLQNKEPLPASLKSFMSVYCFAGMICAYICAHVLFASMDDFMNLPTAILTSCLISLFVFLIVASMKHIAFLYKFFRSYDIESGALSLLSMICVIVRYVSVTPVWVCYLANSSLKKFPEKMTTLCHIYLLVKIIGLWIMCVDFSGMCTCFFNAVLLRCPPNTKCESCKDDTPAKLTTQCGHSFCKKCIEKGRTVMAACPVCKSPIPRAWSMDPMRITIYIMVCII